MTGTGRFEHDTGNRRLAKLFDQGPKPLGRVFKLPHSLILQPERIEMGFRFVDADGMLCHPRHVLFLSCVAQTRVSVQAQGEDGGRSNSRTVPIDSEDHDPTAAAARHKWRGGQRLLYRRGTIGSHKTRETLRSLSANTAAQSRIG